MKVVYMKGGEIVFTKESRSLMVCDGRVDLAASNHFDFLVDKLETLGHFVETGFDIDEGCHWLVKDCGDNCIKIYPQQGEAA